jgi:DNA polymerase type B, organellar and viral
MFNIKQPNKVMRLFGLMDRSFLFLKNLYAKPFSSTSLQDTPKGVFILYTRKCSSEFLTVFLYLDTKSNQLTAYNVHRGPNFYSKFTHFISKTILELELDPNTENLMLVPKFYINKSMISRVEIRSGVKLIGYTNKMGNFPYVVSELKMKVKTLLTWDSTSIRGLVNAFNKTGNRQIISEITKCVASISQPNKTPSRMFSTLTSTHKILSEGCEKWKSFETLLESYLVDFPTEKFVTDFWNEVVIPENMSNPNLKMAIQLRVQLESRGMRSISFVDIIDVKYKDLVISAFKFVLSKISEVYHQDVIIKLIIVYKRVDKSAKSKINTPNSDTELSKPGYSLKKLQLIIPATMDIKEWGCATQNLRTEIWKIKLDSKLYAEVNIRNKMNFVTVYEKRLMGSIKVFSFMDKLRVINKKIDYRTFERIFDDHTIYFLKGEVKLTVEDVKCKYIEKIKPHKKPNNKVITMDLETREINKKLDPVCVSIYDGEIKKTFWIQDFSSSYTMLEASIKYLLVRKYYGYKLYLHNFSYFDGVFLLKVLSDMTIINLTKVLIRDGRILKLVIQFDKAKENKTKSGSNYKGSITIHDSLLILPASLDKLSKVFKCESKGMFPLKFINNPNTSLAFVGDVPGIKYFYHPDPTNQSKAYSLWVDKYNKYIQAYTKNNWDLKQELIKYCEQDVISLHMVILTFTQEIYSKFKVNILNYPTLPSIAFALYRLKYIKSDTVPILSGGIYNDIKRAYYGGFVDVYKVWGENVQGFDVNSLYPSSMAKYPVPVGKPEFFEGDPKLRFKNLFGFVLARVDAPPIERPILPYKITNKNGSQSTIYPTGTWTAWYFTEEIKNAMKYGYKFTIIKGYHFDNQKIFTDYVNELYSIKCSVSSDNPWYTISKLLQNSLYGRFGMSPDIEKNEFMSSSNFQKILKTGTKCVTDFIDLGNKTLVSYLDGPGEHDPNVSVGIAAAIASWSRIQMTHYIMKYGDSICYIDTDGIKTTSSIDPSEIGTKLGMMKYEGTFKEAVFIAPKVYGGISENLEMTVKVKGLKNAISYWKLKLLLYMNKLAIPQDKWSREWDKGYISILKQIYTLSATENKRRIIRDSCNKIVGTLPFILHEGKKLLIPKYTLYYLPSILLVKLRISPPQTIPLNLRISSGANIIYLPPPLPEIIYLPAPLPEVIYIFPAPQTYMNLLAAPKSYLALPKPKELLRITAPTSYQFSGDTIEELNIIYILPKVFYMSPPLPSIIYLPGEVQKCLPAPPILLSLPPPKANQDTSKVLYENPGLPKVIYIEPSLDQIIYLPGKVSVLRHRFKVIAVLLLVLIYIAYFRDVFSVIGSFIFVPSPGENINVIYHQEILETEIECLLPSDWDWSKRSEDTSTELDRYRYLGYKYVFLALGLIAFSLAFWYWLNRSVSSSSGEGGNNSSISIRDAFPGENTPNLKDIPSIRYEDRDFVRRNIRDSFFEDIRLSTQLRERNEDLALDTMNLNIRSVSREEMIRRIHESDASPNTAIDAVQALLRETARVANSEKPTISNALIPYNTVTDLVAYDPGNIPIPATVDMARYEIFIQYLDHYNAIIASYGV